MKLSLKDDINSLSYFKTNYNKILQKLKNNQRPIIITQNGKASGVFMDIDTWQSMIKKINLLKLVYEGEMSFKKKKSKSLEELESYFNNKYGF